jgi:predicted protein tyrosine phosphatase
MRAPDFLVFSRSAAIAYEPIAAVEVCISITNPGGVELALPLSPRFADVLRLAFSDIAGPSPFPFDVLFSSEHARAIIAFVERWRTADRIVIHCVAGRSRSPAVAMALCDRFGWSAAALQEQYPLWNRWVRVELAQCQSPSRKRKRRIR